MKQALPVVLQWARRIVLTSLAVLWRLLLMMAWSFTTDEESSDV